MPNPFTTHVDADAPRPQSPIEIVLHNDTVDELARRLADLRDPVEQSIGELARNLAEAKPVQVRPSDRVRWFTQPVEADKPRSIIGAQLDRARITLHNQSLHAVALGRGESFTASSYDRYDLEPGERLTLETRDQIWAVAREAGAVLGVIVEEFD